MLGTNASIVQETATWIVAIGTPSPWLYEPFGSRSQPTLGMHRGANVA
jgi:hypothetical protein